MNLPAKVEYAYKAIMELAIRYNGDSPIQLNTICESQGVPKKFLIQLLLRLKNAKIVNSLRGMEGGYYLTRPPSQISLADVFKAVDDTIIGSPKKTKSIKASDSDRLILNILADINKDIASRLEGITFDKLIAQVKNAQLIYQI